MSNRMDTPPPERRRRLPENVSGAMPGPRPWTTFDYALAAGFALSFWSVTPLFAVPAFWAAALMPQRL